jgi:hypothetical protein
MDKTIQQTCAELEQQVVCKIRGRDVTRAELSKAFDRVAPIANWKNPIDAIVVFTQDGERELVEYAIEFFTGSKAKLEVIRLQAYCSTYRVTAAGYYATIGA